MAKIITLNNVKKQKALQAGYGYWRTLFDEDFQAGTRLSDLQPKTLYYLAEPGDESATALYGLIIGFSGYGETVTFESLDSKIQSHLLDIHLFISDQIRFEMMFRLGWLERFLGRQYTLYEMVAEFKQIKIRPEQG